MRKYILTGITILAALAVFFGCDDRGNGVKEGEVFRTRHRSQARREHV